MERVRLLRPGESGTPTPWAVICTGQILAKGCGRVFLTEQEYEAQMMEAGQRWRCPHCLAQPVEFDDANFDQHIEKFMAEFGDQVNDDIPF